MARTIKEVDGLIKASLAIRAKAKTNITLHLNAIVGLRSVYANEGNRIDALLEERELLCPDTPAELAPPEPVPPIGM
jgi:hypothetical protein